MADLLSSDHSLQQSLIVDEAMWIDHLLYVDDGYSENMKIKKTE